MVNVCQKRQVLRVIDHVYIPILLQLTAEMGDIRESKLSNFSSYFQ